MIVTDFDTNHKKAPCYQCPDRQLGCHGTCEKYLEYKRTMQEIDDATAENKEVRAYIANLRRINRTNQALYDKRKRSR